MKLSSKQIIFNLIIILLCLNTKAQTVGAESSGYVNFNLKNAPVTNYGSQKISLYGCNTESSTTLTWGVDNQVFPEVPYGPRKKGKKNYYISKYYMASPPVMKEPYDGTPVNIGLVLPDHFTFFGEEPVQVVHLDYTILQPVYLNYVKGNYQYNDSVHRTCDEMGVNLVPMNIECQDFAWRKKKSTPTIIGAKGASGVARMLNDSKNNKVFLPSYDSSANFLDCNISILDDILLEHEVFFVKGDSLVKSIKLTDYYTNDSMKGTDIQLACRVRKEIPPGCKKKKKEKAIPIKKK
ncbi:MAG: hypothetical protein JKY48_11935 [Flavobacteriales bacterium]|nr:hypothetical protein [Flavobacteriales bacterium]